MKPTPVRIDALRQALMATVDALKRSRADLISEDLIEGYVDVFWMEWHGGSLRLTETGRNVMQQLRLAERAA